MTAKFVAINSRIRFIGPRSDEPQQQPYRGVADPFKTSWRTIQQGLC
jgi:hypothetical protein